MSPVIAGLDDKSNEPFICGMDTIGAIETAKDFMVAGTAPDSLYGMCESMWQPDMVSCQHCRLILPSYVCLWGWLICHRLAGLMCMSVWQPHMMISLRDLIYQVHVGIRQKPAGVYSRSCKDLNERSKPQMQCLEGDVQLVEMPELLKLYHPCRVHSQS